MHYNYMDFINLSTKERKSLVDLTLDCREINLLQEGSLKLLCSKIQHCSSLEKCTLIYMHVNEGFIFDSDRCQNIRFISNGNGHRYIDMHNHRWLTSINMGFLIILTLCFIHYLSTLQLKFDFNYYNAGLINAVFFSQSLMFLLLYNCKELISNIMATKSLNEVKQNRIDLLSQAFTECNLDKDQPKITSYRDSGEGFISLQEEKYFLDIPIVELCEAIKDCLEKRIFMLSEDEEWSIEPALSNVSTASLTGFNMRNNTSYYSLQEATYNMQEQEPGDSAKKLRMSI